ncbi:recombinase family protein [Paenirhodobacter sp.]|uniref:recombinase family protein n=1 Tax=Paenirhodobacter sp. TaxID=1965326 RepID=UPI003B512558
MLIGYARTSTIAQRAGLEAQERDLAAVGCERIFVEQVSSVDVVKREKLTEALAFARQGDTLVITKLDRLARSVAHLVALLGQLEAKGVSLRILGMGIDTGTPTGKLMLNILGGVAEFEREIMLERQREGIAKAKADGKYKGRAPTARAKADDVVKLHRDGIGGSEIAKRLGIGRASVYRILGEVQEDAGAGK